MVKAHTRVFGKSGAFDAPKPRTKFTVYNRQVKGAKQVDLTKARTKAINKRKQSLLRELNADNKVNSFVDERIGEREKDQPVSATNLQDEKFLRRFQVERAKQLMKARKSTFSLEDEDELTHLGQSIGSVSGRDDQDEYEHQGFSDDEDGKIDAQQVRFAHFGGGELEQEKPQEFRAGMPISKFMELTRDPTPEERAKMSKKEIMESLIQKSKLYKLDRQIRNQELQAMATELDRNFQDVFQLLEFKTDMDWMDEKIAKRADEMYQGTIGLDGKAIPSFAGDDTNAFDNFTMEARRLAAAQRAYAAEKLKSTDDLLREERERLLRLENMRQQRMRGDEAALSWEAAEAAFNAGRDLTERDEEWDLEDELESRAKDVSKLPARIAALRKRRAEIKLWKRKEAERQSRLEGKKSASDSESESDPMASSDEEMGDHDDDDVGAKPKVRFASGDDLEENFELDDDMIVDSDASDSDASGEDDEDDLSVSSKKRRSGMDDDEKPKLKSALRTRVSPEEAAKALPFVFPAPRNFQQLQALFDTRGDETPEAITDHETIVKRLQTLHHVKLNMPENESRMEILLRCLYRYMRVTCERETARIAKYESKRPTKEVAVPQYSSADMTFAKLDWLTREIFALSEMLPRYSAKVARELVEAIAANAHERLQVSDEENNTRDEEKEENASNSEDPEQSKARRFEPLDHMTDHLPQAPSAEDAEEPSPKNDAASIYRKSDMPRPHEVMAFKLLGAVYPVTDYRHNVVTPMVTLMAEILSTFPIRGGRDLAVAIFVAALLIEWSSESKRVIPEVLAFLHSVLSRGFALEKYVQSLERKPNATATATATSKPLATGLKLGSKPVAPETSSDSTSPAKLTEKELAIPKLISGYPIERRKHYVETKVVNLLLHELALKSKSEEKQSSSSPAKLLDGSIWAGFDLSLPSDPIEIVTSFLRGGEAPHATFAESIPISLLFLPHNDFPVFKQRSFKTAMLNTILNLIRLYARILSGTPAFVEIIAPILCVLDTILLKGKCPTDREPEMTSSAILHSVWEQKRPDVPPGERVLLLRSIIHAHIRELLNTPLRKPLLRYAKPVEIATKEPNFMEDFEPGKVESHEKEQAETRKLLKKLKREKKGALREIRRDAQFLALEQRKLQAKLDERKQKRKHEVWAMLERERQDTNPFAKVSRKK